jgi:hypothetical protein
MTIFPLPLIDYQFVRLPLNNNNKCDRQNRAPRRETPEPETVRSVSGTSLS